MKYTCHICKGEFDSGWSDEEAIAEFRRRYPKYPITEACYVCDDCYTKAMEPHNVYLH